MQSIAANSLGLRSPEISLRHPPHSLRVAVIGASSVMGATERDNEHTFPAQLEGLLREAMPHKRIDVINAGIAGYSLADERAMLERRMAPLRADLVILYTGFNDFASYCRGSSRGVARALPMLTVPSWWLSYDLLMKKSLWLLLVCWGAAFGQAYPTKPVRSCRGALPYAAEEDTCGTSWDRSRGSFASSPPFAGRRLHSSGQTAL